MTEPPHSQLLTDNIRAFHPSRAHFQHPREVGRPGTGAYLQLCESQSFVHEDINDIKTDTKEHRGSVSRSRNGRKSPQISSGPETTCSRTGIASPACEREENKQGVRPLTRSRREQATISGESTSRSFRGSVSGSHHIPGPTLKTIRPVWPSARSKDTGANRRTSSCNATLFMDVEQVQPRQRRSCSHHPYNSPPPSSPLRSLGSLPSPTIA